MKKIFCELCQTLQDIVGVDIDMENHEEHLHLKCGNIIDRSL
jgi:hypothetical protein